MSLLPRQLIIRLLLAGFALFAIRVEVAAADEPDDGTAAKSANPAEQVIHEITFKGEAETPQTIRGRVLVMAADGGLLVETPTGRLWTVTPQQLQSRVVTAQKFEPATKDELAALLRAEFGQGFDVLQTEHYVLCSNAGTAYTAWCGQLLERLVTAFRLHWRSDVLNVQPPAFPLQVIIFSQQQQFADYATQDAGPATATSQGYYSLKSNRIVLYDLSATPGSTPAKTTREVWQKIARVPFNVATVIHEATHQLAFNMGLHQRYADNPLWLTEGMAMYFETPDLGNRTGWRTIGKTNPRRLQHFQKYVRDGRPENSLTTLISTDKRFSDPALAQNAYAEAWVLNHFLIKTRRKQYEAWLANLAKKPPLVWGTPEERIKEFEKAFGEISRLEPTFARYVLRLRR